MLNNCFREEKRAKCIPEYFTKERGMIEEINFLFIYNTRAKVLEIQYKLSRQCID